MRLTSPEPSSAIQGRARKKFSFHGGHGSPALTHVSSHIVKVGTQVVTRINYREKKMLHRSCVARIWWLG